MNLEFYELRNAGHLDNHTTGDAVPEQELRILHHNLPGFLPVIL